MESPSVGCSKAGTSEGILATARPVEADNVTAGFVSAPRSKHGRAKQMRCDWMPLCLCSSGPHGNGSQKKDPCCTPLAVVLASLRFSEAAQPAPFPPP